MPRHRFYTSLLALVGLLARAGYGAQGDTASDSTAPDPLATDSLAPMRSMALPSPYRAYAGLGSGLELAGSGSRLLSRAMVGASRDFMNPVPGLAALGAEVWVGTRATGFDGGGRLMLVSNAAGIQVGADYSLRLGRLDAALTAHHPMRRGGILVPGGGIRLDWLPGRGTITASLTMPLLQRSPGRTRPYRVDVAPVEAPDGPAPPPLDPRLDPHLQRTLAELREAARWTSRAVIHFLPPGDAAATAVQARALRDRLERARLPGDPMRHSSAREEISRYHDLLDRAFELALGVRGRSGRALAVALADTARQVLLEEVLLPYDRDLGRIRRAPVLRALCRRAAQAFTARLAAFPDM
jgi:hypothetical protein